MCSLMPLRKAWDEKGSAAAPKCPESRLPPLSRKEPPSPAKTKAQGKYRGPPYWHASQVPPLRIASMLQAIFSSAV